MKYPGKPAKPSEPKEPERWIDYEIKNSISDGDVLFDYMRIREYEFPRMPGRDNLIKYISENPDKWRFEKEYQPYDDYESCYLVIKIPREAEAFENQFYKQQYAAYQTNLTKYPAKLAEYEKKLAEWEAGRGPFEEEERKKKIAAARKILQDEGEL